MTLPKDKKIDQEHIESMKIAVEQYDIAQSILIRWKSMLNTWFRRQEKGSESPNFHTYLCMVCTENYRVS